MAGLYCGVQCAACPNLRSLEGEFGDEEHEEYVEDGCATRCKDGNFRGSEGLCRRCSEMSELESALQTNSKR